MITSESLFLSVHVLLSLVGILSGLIVLYGLLNSQPLRGWTALFLSTSILTSLTGFPLPPFGLDPARVVGAISLVLLGLAAIALYSFSLAGLARPIYIASATAALYLNVFVGVAQAFQKVSLLSSLAPTQSEPPFLVAQTIVLAVFVLFGVLAVRRFHPGFQT
ncbi:MAG: hypothetical protein QOI12_126 [Alphaproteobacteria bacterium]|jgi:hypothetical protein|nr:hypothetical protein [Alphaproteobacteria bacterium]